MSLLYSSNFNYPEGNLRKNQEIFMDSSQHYHHRQHHQQQQLQQLQQLQQNTQQQQQQQQNNSGLMRYHSAPGSFFENLVNGSSSGTGDQEDYRYFRSSSPEIDTLLAKYGDSGSSDHDHMREEFGEKSIMKQEEVVETNGSSQMMYQTLQVQGPGNNNNNNTNNTMDISFGVPANSMVLEKYSLQAKMAAGNGSNLIRQNSSPAGLFSNLGVDNGFAVMRAGNNSTTNGASGPATSSSSLHNHLNFSSGQPSRLMPHQIAEIGNQNTRTRSPEKGLGGSNRQYNMSNNFNSDSWDDIPFNGLKGARENDGNNMCFDLNSMDISQNGRSSGGSRSNNGLTHHLSLPKTSSEIAAVEKFLHFQGSIPCKIRAKRGCATHPRSIAERVRRTRISERMRKLQDLFPNMDKQTNTADMLDLAVEYIKDLQKQVKTLTDKKAKCIC